MKLHDSSPLSPIFELVLGPHKSAPTSIASGLSSQSGKPACQLKCGAGGHGFLHVTRHHFGGVENTATASGGEW